MAYTTTSDSIVIKATLTDKGRKLLTRGNFRVAKFALGDDEIDYDLVDGSLLNSRIDINLPGEDEPLVDYDPAVSNTKFFEAIPNRNRNIIYGLNSFDEGVLYLSKEDIDDMGSALHAHILYLPTLKQNKKLSISPTLSGSVYYLSVNDETTNKLESISNFRFLTTNRLENIKFVIESGVDVPPLGPSELAQENTRPSFKNKTDYILKKFMLDLDFFIYADNKFFRKIVGIGRGSEFKNFASGEVVINFTTGKESPPISLESEYDFFATFVTKGVQNEIYSFDSEETSGDTSFEHSALNGPRGSVVAFNPLIDQELQTTSTGERDFRYTEYGRTNQVVFSELPSDQFDYIDTTIYVIGATTNSRIQIPVRLIRFSGT